MERGCVNPIFPGLNSLSGLSTSTWTKISQSEVINFISFCKDVVNYDTGVLKLDASEKTYPDFITVDSDYIHSKKHVAYAQDVAASTAYFFHLNAMAFLEPWDHQYPFQTVTGSTLGTDGTNQYVAEIDRACARTAAYLACYTYFPKAPTATAFGADMTYLRPCESSCNNFKTVCKIQCCDEGVKCVFDYSNYSGDDGSIVTGYYDADGPSEYCTGSAHLSTQPSHVVIVLGIVALLSVLVM